MRILAGLVAATALVLIVMVLTGGFAPSVTTRSASPAAVRTTSSPGASPTGPHKVTISFTEAQLTDAARDYTPLTVSGITVTAPRIRLEPGRLTLTATGRAFIVSGPIVVVASPLVTNGTASARIESATFGGVALPDATKRDVADTFARVLAANIPSGVRVTSMTVASGVLVVEAEQA